jgi:lysosomal alpha-mannosidase
MNDEATTYYTDIIDQQTLGLKFIREEFGPCARPRSAWQIDPFGHSREQASLFGQFGFDGQFLGRVDYQDFDLRGKMKTREMIMQGSDNLGEISRLFTGILPNGYSPPSGFCWDTYCGNAPLTESNQDYKVNAFIKYTENQASFYKTNNLIMTMGADFQYSNAFMWFDNLDRLITFVNRRQSNGSKINVFYSTTACFLYSLNKANTTWPLKGDDFFPYTEEKYKFWTGYFTSRPGLKINVKKSRLVLNAIK